MNLCAEIASQSVFVGCVKVLYFALVLNRLFLEEIKSGALSISVLNNQQKCSVVLYFLAPDHPVLIVCVSYPGLPNYLTWRRFCEPGLVLESWEDMKTIFPEEAVKQLQTVYGWDIIIYASPLV